MPASTRIAEEGDEHDAILSYRTDRRSRSDAMSGSNRPFTRCGFELLEFAADAPRAEGKWNGLSSTWRR